MPKRQYRPGPADYNGGIRRALTNSSILARERVRDTVGAAEDVRVQDTKHPLVTETFDRVRGRTVDIDLLHPVRLVQHVGSLSAPGRALRKRCVEPWATQLDAADRIRRTNARIES